jgi:hypothetical protein
VGSVDGGFFICVKVNWNDSPAEILDKEPP